MKKLSDLYPNQEDILIKDIKINSKEIEAGDIFVCVKGVNADRHDFIDEAIENGAAAVVVSKDISKKHVPVIKVNDTNKELVGLARKLYDFKDEDLKLVGVTGTNGKTTIALIIKQLMGDICGYIGTNGIISSNFNEQIRNTTPDSDRLYKYFRRFIDDGCKILSMETSSESFYRKRLETLKFEIGIISNITEDHLNIHKTLENYVDCKMDLLRKVKDDGYSILNTDDEFYNLALANAHGTILTFGKDKNATIRLLDIEEYIDSAKIKISYDNKIYEFMSPYLGEVNAYNLMASLLACIALGEKIENLIDRVKTLTKIAGRMDVVYNKDFTVMLDYAHTTDAFRKILPILNRIKKNRLIIVTGSAGGREKEKRPVIGKYILENSDLVIFTMDDPRYENVIDIINDLISQSNNKNYEIIEDRKDAIFRAIDIAEDGDIILVAGKGTDNYMAIEDKYLEYSDLDVIKEYFESDKN